MGFGPFDVVAPDTTFNVGAVIDVAVEGRKVGSAQFLDIEMKDGSFIGTFQLDADAQGAIGDKLGCGAVAFPRLVDGKIEFG